MVAPEGFEPSSPGPKPGMLVRYTTGLFFFLCTVSTGFII